CHIGRSARHGHIPSPDKGEIVMSEKPLFRSAFDAGNWTPEEVLAFHRARHADFRMEGEDDPPADDKKSAGDTGFTDPDTGEKYGFPANTPTAQMTAEQKAEY